MKDCVLGILPLLFSVLISLQVTATPVRELLMKPSDVGVIHTSHGFSTVVQLPSKPQNVVLGDQAAFRIEFINDSITIKPLRSSAKSNLFIFTDKERYNLTLTSGPQSSVDYVVRLKRTFEDPRQTKTLNKQSIKLGLKLSLLKVTKSGTSSFVDFQILNTSKNKTILSPQNFRFLSQNTSQPIKGLFIEALQLEPGQSVSGSFSFTNLNFVLPYTVIVGIKDKKPIRFGFGVSNPKEAANAIKRMD